MRATRAAAAAMLLALSGASGCALDAGADSGSITHRRSLAIGVKGDQPGLGLKGRDGRYQGFDVDVATYVAGRLGVPPGRITFRTTPSSQREDALRERDVDLVFATYSITAKRKTQVTFGGPYYVAHQDTLVRSGATGINAVRDLRGKRICAVNGSNSWRRVTDERKIAARPVPVPDYRACMTLLASGGIDAVSTDDLILAGFAAQTGGGVRLLNAPFTDEKYGVGLRKGDLAGCEAVNRALTEMYQDGTAGRLLKKWFATSGVSYTTSVPQFEGCS
ncbi:glutamate ABC transporter substrate-binding protein [Actinomadura parmotrematis]|uniref:Glutamate ABC transporter substrate-binding protein n=1 Tax=Actinomadura parmotrematis TaxID=2864039 RepID=A0ABS7FQB7_9ACTN|nr:glutamate ABC transporter substrate-binding protein [Actinomadura parmotrematis]MBW8481944.1 glutamate ABC transporter substrate-binding protein [Actinomadura parmotrematis]